jgi:FHS family glucose/mannose:H+ symporter-like MFS transporter
MYNRKVVFGAACTGMLFFGIAMITLGSIIPDLTIKLNLDEVSAGTFFSILPIGILAGSLAFGPIADRFGYRLLLAVSSFLLFAGFEGIAFSTTKGVITFFILLIGFSGGAINGATNAAVADTSDTNKGAALSLLGAFFGFGALGMPLVLGLLKNVFRFEVIVASTGILTFAAGIFFLLIRYPEPKQTKGFAFSDVLRLVKDKLLIFIAIFLFFQSSFEGIINNWTTTYLTGRLEISQSYALYGLSAYVAGMTVMRLTTGTVLNKIKESNLLYICFGMILAGLIVITYGNAIYTIIPGLFILGAGLSAGFPVMLGFTGDRFAELSGTAFSLVLAFALIGNMLVNYSMGVIAKNYGIVHLTTVAFIQLIILFMFAVIILGILKNNK